VSSYWSVWRIFHASSRLAQSQKRGPKTSVDVDSDVDAIDYLHQEPSLNPLVHFQANPLQRAF
jgi:hypothetical protein